MRRNGKKLEITGQGRKLWDRVGSNGIRWN